MPNGYDVIGNDPYGPPDHRPDIYAQPEEWGPHPEDLQPTQLKIDMDHFVITNEMDHKIFIDIINWTYHELKKGDLKLSSAMREYKRNIPDWKARILWKAIPKFIECVSIDMGMQPGLRLKEGVY